MHATDLCGDDLIGGFMWKYCTGKYISVRISIVKETQIPVCIRYIWWYGSLSAEQRIPLPGYRTEQASMTTEMTLIMSDTA